MAFQEESPVTVYNGPDRGYQVRARVNTDDSFTQLVGFDDAGLDAFGRLPVSNTSTLFESGFAYDLSANQWETTQTTSGTVTHNATTKSATLTAAATSGSLAAIQSRSHLPYERGRAQTIAMTFTMGAAVANVRRRVGYFATGDGVYLEQTSTGVSMVLRSSTTGSTVNTSISQGSWNIDPLDGTGPSGATLDLQYGQILYIDAQWLGTGRVRCGFNIGGQVIWAHAFEHSNVTATQPYTTTFSLPVRYEIESTAASAGATMQAICANVETGGTPNPTSLEFAGNNTANVSTSTTRAALLAIRPSTVYPVGGATNRQTIIAGDISVISVGADVLVEVFYNSTLTGGTWTRAHATSGTDVGVGQTISATGVPIRSFFVPAGTGQAAGTGGLGIASRYPLTLDIAGTTARNLSICATTLTGTGTARATIGWQEVR